MITLVKLGGSLITDKTMRASFREDEMRRIAHEIAAALAQNSDLQLIIGHGSGSFGHFEAKQHNTMAGVQTLEQWHGFASVATIAAELNYLVAKVLHTTGLPIFRVQPSASASVHDGNIISMALGSIEKAVAQRLIPLVYGDVAFDEVRGGTIISTETIFTYLVEHLPVSRILLLGEVSGVYDLQRQVIPEITSANFEAIKPALGGSAGVDVTGGMLTKVEDMLALTQAKPALSIFIFNGKTPGLLQSALLNKPILGTRIAC